MVRLWVRLWARLWRLLGAAPVPPVDAIVDRRYQRGGPHGGGTGCHAGNIGLQAGPGLWLHRWPHGGTAEYPGAGPGHGE